MSSVDLAPVVEARPPDGGLPARRAVMRWAWRPFRRECRQQLLMLGLVIVAVAATILGSTVAKNSPVPANFGFGTAKDMASFQVSDPHLASDVAALRAYSRTEVIENETLPVPGTLETFQLRAQDPRGSFGRPMLTLVSGCYPTRPTEVAATPGVAAAFHLVIGGSWHELIVYT
ncbi:MAG: hypothetical protein ACLQEG_14305 [Acidimicrobiales bacterium]